MEISIFNHPTLLNPSLARIDLIERISNLAHKPPLTNPHESLINFDVQLMHVGNFKRTKNQHNRNRKHRNFLLNQSDVDLSPENYWRLTFPTIEFGHKFLNLVNQINIEKFGFSSKVKFEQSILKMRDNHQKKFKVPHPSLIQKLKTNQFTSPEDERKLYYELDKDSSPNQFILSSLEFGRLDKPTIFDACFCSEYIQSFVSNPSSVNSRCTISIDETSSQIVIKLPQTHQPHGRSTRINCKTVKRIEANLPSILLWLDCSPLFCEDNALENLFTTNNSQQKSRKSGFDHHQMRILPFVGRLIRITFKRDKDCNTFLHHSTRFKLPRINHIFREVRSEPIYTPDNLAKLESVKESLDLAISFQLDKLLHSTILSPDEILELSKLLKGFDSDTLEGALMNLVNNLTDELEESQYKTRPNFRTQTIASKFSIALQAAQSNKSTLFDRRLQFQDNFKCRTVTLTPTGTIFEGPTVEQSNSILRLYDYSPSFIRVAIREEDFSSHHHDREMNSAQFLQERYLPLFSGGLKIAGRNFEFLGYSSSALKDHQAWLVCPFKHRGVVMTAHRIRHNMGDFSKVINIPARYMARIAQAFTTTRKTVTLTHDQLQEIPDIERNGSIFTDGVGTISPKLAQKVEEDLCGTMSISKRKNTNRSSCYQIRLGGYKGMLSVDSVLDGEVVRLRPSMDKFDARESLTLDIASSFRTPLAAFLNRPLIKLLEDLRIPAKVFLQLQTQTVKNIERSRLSMTQAAKLMTTHGLGTNSGLPQILRRLAGLMKTDNPELLQSRFLEDCLDLVVIDCLRDLKYRARIPLSDSYTLVGVADEDKCLNEGEIYACIKPKGKSKKYLKGRIAITRSPCIHPGDVQVVTAIGRPPPGCQRLEGLTNCVVFSVKGKRSLPSCLGGGDLDGDLYNLLTDPRLIPLTSHLCPPALYPPPQMKSLNQPCTIIDGIRFFLDYISSDLVGAIATRHLLIADRSASGSKDPNCLKLAELHSKAVDYPKTGMPVSVSELPKVDGVRPDFMCPEYVLSRRIKDNEHYYESVNALGQLFRAIPAERTEFFESGPLKGILPTSVPGKSSRERLKRLGPLDPDRKITKALQAALREHGQLDFPDPIWRDEFVTLLKSFSNELYKICKQNTLKKSTGFSQEHLSEMEAFVGMILSASSDRRLKRESLSRLIEQTSELFDMLKSEILGEIENIYHHDDEDEDFNQHKQIRKSLDEISLISLSSDFEPNETLISRALAGWIVAIEETNKTFGVHSFGFVCLRILCSELRL